MNFREQEYILEIAENQGITRAAERLHISQPALSKFLNHVEEEIGTPIFIRKGKHFLITEIGNLYLQKAREILKCRDEFKNEAAIILGKEQTQNVTIGLQKLRAPRLTPLIYSSFREIWPNCKINFVYGRGPELLDLLGNQQADVILMSDVNVSQRFESYPIKKDFVLLAAASKCNIPTISKDGDFDVVDLAALECENFLLMPQNYSIRLLANKAFQRSGYYPENIQMVHQLETSINLASMGYGLAFTLNSYTSLFQPLEQVKYYKISQYMEDLDYVAVFRPNVFSRNVISRILKILKTN